MDDPAQQEDPEEASENKLYDGHEEPALEQLTKSRDEEAAEGGDDVPSGSLSSHVASRW
jgi:hypothetical protein